MKGKTGSIIDQLGSGGIREIRPVERPRTVFCICLLAFFGFLAACVSEPPPYEVFVDFDSDLVYEGSSDYPPSSQFTDSPFGGTVHHRSDYTWQLFLGHHVTAVQVHFDALSLNSASNSLCVSGPEGTEAQYFTATDGPGWSRIFHTNLLEWRLQVAASAAEASDGFHVDKVRFWSGGIDEWFANHPEVEIRQGGVRPNVHRLHDRSSFTPFYEPRNHEVHGIISGESDNYYIASGLGPSSPFDFSLIGTETGAPEIVEERHRWFRLSASEADVVAGSFARVYDDILVMTREGEVFLSVNDLGQGFNAFHLAHRSFVREEGEIAAAGRMNMDSRDDLLTVGPTKVRFALREGSARYPVFGSVMAADIPWEDNTIYRSASEVILTDDFNADGYVDVAVIVDLPFFQRTEYDEAIPNPREDPSGFDEWREEHPGKPIDHAHVFLNDQSLGFGNAGPWLFIMANPPAGVSDRVFRTGDFNGDGYADLLIADVPDEQDIWDEATDDTPRQLSLMVALNRSPDGIPAFSAPQTWASLEILSLENIDSTDVVIADLNGDGLDDAVVRTSTFPYGFGPIFKIRVAYSVFSDSPVLEAFGSWVDWTPAQAIYSPGGRIIAGMFTSGSHGAAPEDLYATNGDNLMAHVFISTNLLGSSNPEPKFGFREDRLSRRPIYATGNVNGDGHEDIVVFTGDSNGNVEVLASLSSERFERTAGPWATQLAKDFRSPGEPWQELPFVADVNQDALDDLIIFVAEDDASDGIGYLPHGVFVSVNDGNGHFNPPARWHRGIESYPGVEKVPLIGDFNGNGLVDFAVAVVSPGTFVSVMYAFNSGSRFGPGQDNVWVPGGYDLYFAPDELSFAGGSVFDFAVANVDGDDQDDIVIFQETVPIYIDTGPVADETTMTMFSLRLDLAAPDPLLQTRIEAGVSLKGAPQTNRFAVGQLTGDHFADLASIVSSREYSAGGAHALATWINSDGTGYDGWQQSPQRAYRDFRSAETRVLTGDAAGDAREEIVLIRQGRIGEELEIRVIPVLDVDLDLYVQPVWAEMPTGVPYAGWTSVSAQLRSSQEVLWSQMSPTGAFLMRVHNSGSDVASYKFIANQHIWSETLDVMLLELNPSQRRVREVTELLRESGLRLYDATDGFLRLDDVKLYHPTDNDSLSTWKDRSDGNCDGWVFFHTETGRASARFNCRVNMYANSTPSVLVHEYGHFGFGLRDEYCEDDEDRRTPCGLNSSQTLPLCLTSLMGSSSAVKEFCTELHHAPFAKQPKGQTEAAWTRIMRRAYGPLLGPLLGPWLPVPTRSPAPHRYRERMFEWF